MSDKYVKEEVEKDDLEARNAHAAVSTRRPGKEDILYVVRDKDTDRVGPVCEAPNILAALKATRSVLAARKSDFEGFEVVVVGAREMAGMQFYFETEFKRYALTAGSPISAPPASLPRVPKD